jgi:hypothetical protein
MKLKRSRQERTCKKCGATIAKGDMYGQRSSSIAGQQSINGGKDWTPYRISVKQDLCEQCATK